MAQRIPEVVECHRITGEDCFILKVFIPAMEQLDRSSTIFALRNDDDLDYPVFSGAAAPASAARLVAFWAWSRWTLDFQGNHLVHPGRNISGVPRQPEGAGQQRGCSRSMRASESMCRMVPASHAQRGDPPWPLDAPPGGRHAGPPLRNALHERYARGRPQGATLQRLAGTSRDGAYLSRERPAYDSLRNSENNSR